MSISPMLTRLQYSIAILVFLLIAGCDQKHQTVDNISRAQTHLEEERSKVLKHLEQEFNIAQLQKAIDLGLWQEAASHLKTVSGPDDEVKLAEARLLIKKHRYEKAEHAVQEVLGIDPQNREARLLQAQLSIQAWDLQKATGIAKKLLAENKEDARAGRILGEIALHNRRQQKAMEWAQKVQAWSPEYAGGYLLEAEVQFWKQDPAAAESALKRALQLEPFNPDARFSYGYAIWRRVDATQLDDMAGQWNLALAVDPLHYLTNWHFGNGHTNLTYADYAQPTDSVVNARLDEADALVSAGEVDAAITMTREVGGEYTKSVLPAMMRGSVFYMHYNMNRSARLDSAQTIFRDILDRKQNYGPAHNGLAAVIKKRQFSYLDGYKKLEERIEKTKIPEEGSVFYNVFKDAAYYPGDRVKKMIAQQIGPSKAYLPMINKFGSDFAIPPLHVDLAEAMGNSYFRHGTTFDNRQWMDIRGVGSGATGIEYLERGAYWERNVLAHEYAHLYHGRILTDKESRRIRALYYQAMQDGQALDYYASNNESEYFAQGYAGFLSKKKVHPLNHKSMNTRKYIQQEDPDLYTFIDSLITKQQAYLNGDKPALSDNWAQTHQSLAQQLQRRDQFDGAASHLDTALTYSSDYLPALLAYADLEAERGAFEQAKQYVGRAEKLNSNYAPIYTAKANIFHQQALQEKLPAEQAIEQQGPLLSRAFEQETDLSVRARVNQTYRQRLYDYGKTIEAIKVAEQYLDDAPTVSTYLRDRKEQAEAYKYELRSRLGYQEKVLPYFRDLVAQNPQNFGYRQALADVLYRAGQLDSARQVLEEGQKILESANEGRPAYTLRIARVDVATGDTAGLRQEIGSINPKKLNIDDKLLLAEIYIDLDDISQSRSLLDGIEEPILPRVNAQLKYAKAKQAAATNNAEQAIKYFQMALEDNPYHREAQLQLAQLLEDQGDGEAADEQRADAKKLGIKL